MSARSRTVALTILLALVPAETALGAAPSPPGTAVENAEARYEELFATASLWRVGDNVERVEAARAELAAAGEPAIRWLLDRHLGAETTLERRALDAVLLARREIAAPLVLARIRRDGDLSPPERINLARLARKLRLPEAAGTLAEWIAGTGDLSPGETRALAQEALAALAALDGERAAATARGLLDAPDPWVRVAAVRALGRSGRAEAATDLAAVAVGPDGVIVRGAAALALVDLGPPAVAPLLAALDHCARPDAAPAACGFAIRAGAALLPRLPAGDRRTLREALDRVATLGPAAVAGLVVDLVYEGERSPGR